MNRRPGYIYKPMVAVSRQAKESPRERPAQLDYAMWHARLRGHNDWGTSAWPIQFKSRPVKIAVLYRGSDEAVQRAA